MDTQSTISSGLTDIVAVLIGATRCLPGSFRQTALFGSADCHGIVDRGRLSQLCFWSSKKLGLT